MAAIAALLLAPAGALARVAYVTGSFTSTFAAPVDLQTHVLGAEVPIDDGESPPRAVEITPDGRTAWVTSETVGGVDFLGWLVPIDIATNTAEAPISLGANVPVALAITPDGTRAYTANRFEDTVSVVDLTTRTLVTTLSGVGDEPSSIAITPDGTRAYVTDSGDDEVQVINLADNSLGPRIAVGEEPSAVAITPDGTRAYVTDRLGDDIRSIALATNAAGAAIPVGEHPNLIAITPDSRRAYVLSDEEAEPVVAVDLDAGTAEGPIALEGGYLQDVSILPDGSRAYLTDISATKLQYIGIPANTFDGGFAATENPSSIAIVPNQPPHAAFTSSPPAPAPGAAVSFDASASTDSDGTVAKYEWNFGDGSATTTAGAGATHTYAAAGTYQVTLTETDDEGCSLQFVFPGQTAYCNGSGVARVTHPVTVTAPGSSSGPSSSSGSTSGAQGQTRRPHRPHHHHPHRPCVALTVAASSFVPERRPGHVVPGVRVRVAPSVPGEVTIRATLLRKHGKVSLGKKTAKVRRWRRVRFVLPSALRGKLPYGTPVKVKVAATLRPKNSSTCVLKKRQEPTLLDLHIVRVFPRAVQFKRPA